jgi:hypothetical protein
MRDSTCLLPALGAALLLVVAARADAIDLTGTWEGRLRCEVSRDDAPRMTSIDPVTVLISQSGENTIHIFTETAPGGLQMQGVVVDTAASQANGRLSALLCGNDVVAGAFSLNGRAENAGGPGGTLRADVAGFLNGVQPVVYLCTLMASRVTTADPGVRACGS